MHNSYDQRIRRIAKVMKGHYEKLTGDEGDDNERWALITLAYQEIFANTHVHYDASGSTAQLDRIEHSLGRIIKLEVTQMAGIEDVLTELRELPNLGDSLDALFAKLAVLIGANDPAKTAEAVSLLVAHKARTKAAIVFHTPAEGQIPPDPNAPPV